MVVDCIVPWSVVQQETSKLSLRERRDADQELHVILGPHRTMTNDEQHGQSSKPSPAVPTSQLRIAMSVYRMPK